MSLLLVVVLIAPPIVAAAAQSDDISMDSAKWQSQAQQDRGRYEFHSCAVGQAGFDTSETVVQAAVYTPIPTTPGESPGGVSPPGARRTVQERLRSYGSHHPAVGLRPKRSQ